MNSDPTKWDLRFLELAKTVAQWSKDPSTKCGAVIVTGGNHVLSLGYNGFPAGIRDELDLLKDRDAKLARMVHAEMNALLWAGRKAYGQTLYTYPLLPCPRCAVHMIQGGICNIIAPKADAAREKRWNLKLTRDLLYEANVGVKEIG